MEFRYFWTITAVASMVSRSFVYSETFTTVKDEVDGVVLTPSFDGLDTVRPVADSAETLNITIDWNIVSIIDFDETNGFIEISGFVSLEWVPSAYTPSTLDITELVRNDKMWTPSIILVNSLKTYEIIGYDTSVKVRVNLGTLHCQWQPWVITRIACSPNVQYYPFDRQTCSFRFSVWGYQDSEVKLTTKNSEWGFLYFEENGEWKIETTSSETNLVGSISTVDFKIELVRRPLYYVINLIAPVILLGAVNAFTFLLPVESGERVGFAITCFLAYVVLLNMIMGFLPTSAAPLSYLSYYTFMMMVFSAGVSVMTIITIRVHYKTEQDHVPAAIALFYRCLTCKVCKRKGQTADRVRTVTPSTASVSWDDDSENIIRQESVTNRTHSKDKDEQAKVSWKQIAVFLDFLLFCAFLGGQSFFSVAYLVPIFIN